VIPDISLLSRGDFSGQNPGRKKCALKKIKRMREPRRNLDTRLETSDSISTADGEILDKALPTEFITF
jgi:hypothetical protein